MSAFAPRVFYLAHGGGPLPLLRDGGHEDMVACLRQVSASLERPSAIVVVSAHWEADVPTVTGSPAPPLLYDYYGFPPTAYRIKYPCPGNPSLAERVRDALKRRGWNDAAIDDSRGLDHGVFVPLKIMFPEADISCVQLSLVRGLSPEEHIRIGGALRDLAEHEDNLLVIGSGMSFHNMAAFGAPDPSAVRPKNEAFEAWLIDTLSASAPFSEDERRGRLLGWEGAPASRYAHPREEHLLPLHVCYGVHQTHCSKHFETTVLNVRVSMFLW